MRRFGFMKISKQPLPEPLHTELVNYVYDLVGCMHFVYDDLGNGLPEYVYQEALAKYLTIKGYSIRKEYTHHPTFLGEPLNSSVRMDLVVEMPKGNVIVECKSIAHLGDREQFQTFGYLRGTGFPIALLVNFGTYPHAEIQRYYFSDGIVRAF